jgi:hypothetical protein
MREVYFPALALTRHRPQAPKYYGYTAMDWLKQYGFFAGMFVWVVFTYVHYFELFEDIENKGPGYQWFVALFAGLSLLLVLPAVLGFFWWAAGALVRYSIWQLRHPMHWRWFWFVILLFFSYVEVDPLDVIHPAMSRKGLGLAPNLLKLYDGKLELFQFQWGYFLLWLLFWFLVIAVHWSYLLNGLRVVWFYTRRFNRYGASILTGFRETLAVARSEPVTVQWPRERAPLPARFRGVPRLAVEQLTSEQAARIVAADSSAAITAAPGQPTVLFVDLGCFSYDPALAELAGETGAPLLEFADYWAGPTQMREELVVPLKRPAAEAAP